MYLFELGTRPWEVKEATEEETLIKRQRIELYEAFCYNHIAQMKFAQAKSQVKK